jgi:hypothetical protein
MFSFKRSLIALVGILVLVGGLAAVMPLVGQGQGQAPFAQRTYYLTQTEHNGSQALTACAAGYHMASLWEIFDTSNLKYNTQLGFTSSDSGFGPPNAFGWVRTGHHSNSFASPGLTNCNAWTSFNSNHLGTIVNLEIFWDSASVTRVSPWASGTATCFTQVRVWCVQD